MTYEEIARKYGLSTGSADKKDSSSNKKKPSSDKKKPSQTSSTYEDIARKYLTPTATLQDEYIDPKYLAILESEDFELYSQKGREAANPKWEDSFAPLDILGWKPFGEGAQVGNMVTFAEENGAKATESSANALRGGGSTSEHTELINLINSYMKDEEKSIYNYYIGKGETEKAAEYLNAVTDTLRQRQAGKMVEQADNNALELVFSAVGGINQFASGVGNLDNFVKGTEADPTTAVQYAHSAMSSNNSGVWKVANDVATTTANMLPSILVSTIPVVGQPLGLATMGASVVGNSYAEMRNLGYDEWQARGYATLVGAAETGLQALLGGISKLGGKYSVSTAVTNLVSKFDNALARLAIKIPLNMASEGLEESLQTVLEPAFKALVTGEQFEGAEWNEILYSGLLGALSAGFLEGAPTIAGTAATNINAKKVYGDGSTLVNEALGVAPEGSELSTLANKYKGKLDGGKSLSGQQIVLLDEAIRSNDTTTIKKAALRRLGELGETTDVTPVAEVLTKYALGEKLSSKDNAVLNNSDFGHQVLAELNTDNIKSGGLGNNWAENIGTRRVSPEVYNKELYDLAKQQAGINEAIEKGAVAKTIAESENAAKGKLDVSESGKTVYTDEKGNTEDVTINKIVSTKGGIKVELEDGKTVSASDLSFSSSEEALMYEMVARMEVAPDTANEIISTFKPANSKQASMYFAGVPLAYQYGKIGYEAGLKNIGLSEQQKRIAYNRGRMDAVTEAKASTKSKVSNTQKKTEASAGKSGIIYERGFTYDESKATDIQKASMAGIEVINKMSSLEVHIFESRVENGKRVAYVNGKKVKAPNGYFTDGNKIYIDFNAGNGGEGAMLYTMSHEVAHYIRKWNAKGFKELGDFLISEYGKHGVPVNALLEAQKDTIKKRYAEENKTLPSEAKLADMAYEELVADAMSTMFADPKAYEKLAKLKKKNRTLWEKLGEAIKALLDKIKSALGIYSKYTPDAIEADYVKKFAPDVYEKLQDLYLKAFVEADANYASAEQTLGSQGIIVDSSTDSASIMSVRDVLDDSQRKKVSEALAERFGVTEQEAMQWLTAETSLASLILNPKYSQYLDYTPDPNEVAIKQNSDYPQGTVDFSPICAKRREFTSVMNNILRLFPNHVFAATDLAKIRSIMQEEGMTIPCGICYVEDRRQLDTIVAQNFIDSLKLYRDGSKTRPDGKAFNANQLKGLSLIDGDSYTPSIYELVSLEGLNVLKEKNPNMAEAWIKFNNARGMQSVRLLANEAEYKRQILKYNKQTVKSKNDKGGLRVYSFSDAEMFHLIDIIQVITDSATVGLSLQGYTKVNEYARAVKDTGEKLNRSLIPKGELGYHIENGEVVLDYDTVEGIDINHPDFFDNKDNPNVGNITIGVSDVQIRAAMVSDFVDQIIPFHTGQSEEVLGEKGISTWSNYKDFQTEKDIATGKVSDHQINIYTEVLQVLEKEGKPINKRTFVEKFLQVCKDNGLTPRFSQFLNTNAKGEYVYTEGYHKMLVDFKTFAQTEAGEYLPQMPVKPIFDNGYITKILKDYVKSQKVKDAELAKSMPKVIERITNEIVNPSETNQAKLTSNKKPTSDSDIRYDDRGSSNDFLTEYSVQTALYDSLDHADKGDDNLIRVSSMPRYIVDLIGIDGDFYIYRNHAYENMVSEKQAKEDDRFDSDAHYHNLGIETMTDAVMSLEHPIMTIATKSKYGNPTVIMLLPVFGKNNAPLYSVLSFYANKPINGDLTRKPHIVLTIHERDFFEDGGRAGISDVVKSAVSDGRVLDFDKKRREDLSVIAKSAGLGNITEASLKKSLAQFRKFVNSFREENTISYSDRAEKKAANTFVTHMRNIVENTGGWDVHDVFDYVGENSNLNFIERILGKDKAVKKDLESFLADIDDTNILQGFSWFMGEAYKRKAQRYRGGRLSSPYVGAVRTFRNAIHNRINEIMTVKANGTNLGVKNGEVSLEEVKAIFDRLNSNDDIGALAEKVFATARKLGVNIRFANQTFSKKAGGGDALGDMIELKTSYFNDTAYTDQRKAQTILHELIHICTVYVMNANGEFAGDVHYGSDKTLNYELISNAATRLNRIYSEIKSDPNFKGQYGIRNAKEMVAELANPEFVELLKKKTLWEQVLDWICELFGFRTGTSAYDNAMACLDYILDNPEVSEYKEHALRARKAAHSRYGGAFGSTVLADGQVRYSDRASKKASYAPTFYSHMGKVIDDIKLEKMGTSSILNHLKNRGVKDEELKWSGIEAFLEGKKSVTKAELQEFVAGSQLQIEEEMSDPVAKIDIRKTEGEDYAYALYDENGNEVDRYFYDYSGELESEKTGETFLDVETLEEEIRRDSDHTRWSQYKLDGGENYRELVFKLPNSSYTNRAMRGHWGQDAEGVLAHARIQDFTVDGKKMLFIEEIQSDWHNEGHSKGYSTKEYEDAVESQDKLYNEYKKLDLAFHKYVRSNEFMTDPEDVRKKKHDWLRGKAEAAYEKYLKSKTAVDSLKQKGAGDTPDAPFKDTYHEYVLKRLLRMAAEEGYDSIGWTPADIQSKRWSEDYAEGYRIEYDQEMPKFLRKYGKKWGATVGKTTLKPGENMPEDIQEMIDDLERDIEQNQMQMDELDEDNDYRLFLQDGIEDMRSTIERARKPYVGETVWSMDITDSMKDSVLFEGQAMYSDRVTEKKTLDFLNKQLERGEYNAETNPDGGYYVTYKSMSFWGYDEDGNAILRSPMAEYVDGKLSGAYLIPKDKSEHIWYQATETLDEKTGMPTGLLVKVKVPSKKNPNKTSEVYLPASEHPALINEDWSNLYFNLKKKVMKNGKWENSDVKARYNPYEHSSDSMLNDQFKGAYLRDNLVTVKMYVPVSEDNGAYRAQWSKDATGWTDWKSGDVATAINKQKDLKRRLYLSRYATPVEIVPDSEVAQAYKGYIEGTDVAIPDNVVPPNLLKELRKIGVPIEESGRLLYQDRGTDSFSNRSLLAGALETAAQNDIEREKLKQYKQKIDLINSEEQKLHELREKIKELSFKKGARDNEAIKSLQFEANQAANRINTYDRQLLNLESTAALKGVLEREKAMLRKRLEKKGKEALSTYKEKAAETQRELLTRYQESRTKAIEGRNKTEMRHKIKKVVSDLNSLLLNPTKDKHVPIGLQFVVAEALDAINMDTMNAEERVAYYNDLISKSTDPDEIAMLTKKRDFFEYRDANFKERITALKNAYAEFKESDDPLIRNAHNDAIEDLIKNTADAVGNKSLKDMSLMQLEAVYNMYKAISATVRNANKMFKEGRQETVTENSEAVKTEVREVGGHKDRTLKMLKALKKFGWNMLKPITAMKAIGSKTFEKLFANVRAAEDTWAVDVSEAKQFYEDVSSKYGYKKWDFKKRYSFKDSAGNDFSLTLDQIMSLYAYSKREQADKHLEFGGFIFDDAIEVTERKGKFGIPLKYEVNDANPYRLRKEDLLAITDSLTTEQKGFIDEMQTYLSDVMGEKGNEVSLAMYDIKLYNEKNYFPLKTSRYFREFDPEKSGTPKVKNAGFSKKTVPQAGNPIVLSNFMDVWAGHVNDMSMYHAFVLPLEDFMRVYNYSSTAGGYDSVQQYIKNAYGAEANQYIERLMDDLNGGARVDSTADPINKGLALFKKGSVFASASVVIQQPSAIARALAYINPKYFVTATPSAMNLVKHKSLWAEVKKYAPVAIIKEMGYFDTGIGRSSVEWIKGNQTAMDKVDDVLSKAPAIADELCWVHIWEAVKRETAAKGQFKVGSEEFLKECGRRFTEVITNTQVYDSVLSRSGMMRSKDTGMKMATAFLAEPTTTVNMMVDGIIQGKRGNKKFTASTVGAVSASVILNSILVALVYAARDGDEDETYAEKYIGSLTTELIDGFNPLTYIPFVKDIWSIAQGYDVERSDMTVVSKLWESVEGLFNEDKSGLDKVLDVAGTVSSLFGIPLKNIIRDAKGMYNLAETILSGTPTTRGGVGDALEGAVTSAIPLWDRIVGTDSKSDNLYDAIMSGDKEYQKRLESGYKDGKAVETAKRKALRENDSRIKEAAQARLDGDIAEYTRIAKAIIAEGNFSQDTVVAAINAEITALKKDDGSASTPTDSNKVESIYKIGDYYSAIEGRDEATAYAVKNDIIRTAIANGKDKDEAEADFNSSFASHLRELYETGEITDSKAKSMLINYGGKSEEDAQSKVQYWAFKKRYPDYDLSEEAVEKYYSDVEPSGIGISVYYDYSKRRAKCKGSDADGDGKTDSGSVKSEVLKVIDSLPITSKQKDTLYYLNGWSQSTIYQAPWR